MLDRVTGFLAETALERLDGGTVRSRKMACAVVAVADADLAVLGFRHAEGCNGARRHVLSLVCIQSFAKNPFQFFFSAPVSLFTLKNWLIHKIEPFF